MSKNKFRRLLPAKKKEEIEPVVTEAKKETRRNISLACTECQKKKTKCSGTMPCTRCATKARHCLYNQSGDRRRKAYTARLLNSHAALVRLAAKLRSTNPEEISWLVWQIQSLPSNEDAVEYLLHTLH